MIKSGHYRTTAGSTIEIYGKYQSAWRGQFDRFEEFACDYCVVVDVDRQEGDLIWECDVCGGGRAKLFPDNGEAGQ